MFDLSKVKKSFYCFLLVFGLFSCSSDEGGGTDPVDPVCGNPTSISVVKQANGNLLISWTQATGANTYEIEYGETGFSRGSGTTITAAGGNTTINAGAVEQGKAYQAYIRSNCGNSTFGDWVGPYSFSIAVTCPKIIPGDVRVDNLQYTSKLNIYWGDTPDNYAAATSFTVEYGLQGFTQGSGTSVNTSNLFYDLDGLAPDSTYDIYITTNCGSDSADTVGPFIGETRECTPPNQMNTSFNDSSMEYQLDWGSPGAFDIEYEVEYGVQGFTTGSGTRTSVGSNSVEYVALANLSFDTTYDWYVRSICGATEGSWVGPDSYTTPTECDETMNGN